VVQIKGKPQLQVKNPSAFHVSFIDIKVATGKQEREVDAPLMVAPFSERLYPFDDAMRGRPEAVIFSVINDYGGHTTPTRVPLSTLQ
jgi:chaperone protein EcpD